MFFIQQIFLENNPWHKLQITEMPSVKKFCLNMKKKNLKNNYKKIEPVRISKILMPLFIYSQDYSLKLNEQKLNNPLLATIIVDGNELGIKREDQQTLNIISKCGRYVETSLKRLKGVYQAFSTT